MCPPRDTWVRVFISHKAEDKELAFATSQILKAECTNLRCFVSGSDYSQDWLRTIKSELASADVLLLLFTSPAKQWDWPLYEVGLFTPLDDTLPKRSIIYLYSGENRPAPLKHLHGVRVDPNDLSDIEKFLSKFYKTSEITGIDPPLLQRISKEEISKQAKKLAKAFMTAAAVPIFPTYRIVLKAPKKQDGGLTINSTTIPLSCRIEKMSPPTLSIFGFANPPKTWGQVLNSVTEDVEWKNELDDQFNISIDDRVAYPTSHTFRGLEDNRNFRAMITRIERADPQILRIAIAFIPVPTPATFGGPAFNLLRLSTRFQSEVIGAFYGRLNEKIKKFGKNRAFKSLLGAIRNIERESEEFRFLDPHNVASAFSEESGDRETVAEIFKNWELLREKLFLFSENNNADEMETLLGELRIINMTFLKMVSRRHCELIDKDAAKVIADYDELNGSKSELLVKFDESVKEVKNKFDQVRGILSTASFLLPICTIRAKWKEKSGGMEYLEADQDGDLVVSDANQLFLEMFDILHKLPDPDGVRPTTMPALMNRIKKYIVNPEVNLKKILHDQRTAIDEMIFKCGQFEAKAPLPFNDGHPSPVFKNKSFLPFLIRKEIRGDEDKQHSTLFSIAFLQDFWPLDQKENPYNDENPYYLSVKKEVESIELDVALSQ